MSRIRDFHINMRFHAMWPAVPFSQGNRLHKWHGVFAPVLRESTPDEGLAVLRMAVGVNATAAQTHFRLFFLAQGRQGELAQDGEIPRGVTFADTAVILAEDHIEGPVQSHFSPLYVSLRVSQIGRLSATGSPCFLRPTSSPSAPIASAAYPYEI